MTETVATRLKQPYLLFIGDVALRSFAKTALGLIHWRRDAVFGQLRFPDNEMSLGVPDVTLQQAVDASVGSLVIGVNPVGGSFGLRWNETLIEAAAMGLDIVSGLHKRLETVPGLAEAAQKSSARLINVRVPPADIPIATGRKRSGLRVLAVGTDCAVGKKYTALALTQALQNRSIKATFRATGQTGIMIAGSGIPIDAVVSDFVAGAAETLSPENEADHWDVIEGQGSLFHPSFAGVSLGLLHGSQPDAIVLCHDATRIGIETAPLAPIPDLRAAIELNLACGRITNADIRCIGVSVNTSGLPEAERAPYKVEISARLGLPCVDPIADGCDILARALEAIMQERS
jgi:uncharacterized NAD-dependent epimerase/dehydratase family protein